MTRHSAGSTTPPSERDEWRTPRFVFDYMARRFAFDVDLAATANNALCPVYITKQENALGQDWVECGACGWLNPPYSRIDPFLIKAREQAGRGFTTVVLMPAPNGEDRYGKHVFDVASEVLFITGRIAHLRPNGSPVSGSRFGSCIAVYRGRDLGHTRYMHALRTEMLKLARVTETDDA